jgi:hypothetical protein
LYRKMPGYISSLSYTFDNTNTNWETAKLPEDMNLLDPDIRESSSPGALQLPKHIDVSVSFVPVGVYRPEFRGIMYSLYDDSAENGNVETGLMPTNGNRVNYFIEYFEDNKPVIYTGTTVDKNGKRVSYAGDPIQSIEPAADTIPAKTGAKAEGTATNSTDKPGTATSSNTATTETTSTTTTEDTATTEQRSPILTDPNAGIPSFLQNENSAGTNDTNTPPPIGNTPDSKTTNSKPIVTSPSTITPSITAVEEKIFQLAVVGTNPVKLYPYVGERGIWFAVGASNANKLGYGAFGPGKDAAIAYIRSQIGVKEDGTTNATDQG